MNTKGRGCMRAVGVLAAAMALAAPAMAQHGGGHGGGGGGGGAHFGGGGHWGGGGAHVSGGHFGAGAVTGGGYAFRGSGLGGARFAASGAHVGGAPRFSGGAGRGYAMGMAGSRSSAGVRGGWAAYGDRPAGGGRAAEGYRSPHGYSTGAYWGGGYWRGGYWPRCFYGSGYSWFLPILPLAYATYWYAGVPYYYANDVYYTWSPDYDGYIATDPPPAAESSGPDASGSALPAGAAGETGPGSAAQIFMYPKNGQSDEQQSADRRECQQWAASQTAGQPESGGVSGSDYRRAMMACAEGRGYSTN